MIKNIKLKKQNTSVNKLKSSPSSKPKRPIYKLILIIVSIPIAIALFIALAIGSIHLSRMIKIENDKRTLTTETAQARDKQEFLIDQEHQQKIDTISSLGVVDSALKAYSEKADTCALIGSQAGWVYTGWKQKCFFAYTDLLPTSLPREDLIAKISTNPAATGLFGSPDTGQYARMCALYVKSHSPTLRFIESVQLGDAKELRCPASLADKDNNAYHKRVVRIIRTFTNEEISRSGSYIEVTTRGEYYASKDLGCKPIMCGSPLDSPIPAFK